ncbi:MAG: 6-phosphogluconolactonase [Nitrospiraceae bacterium]|nr:6-phosphogluconolactonase [Nitrospiraceae bacterium]
MRTIEALRRALVFDSEAVMNAAMAGTWRELCLASVKARGRFVAAVSGGRTPLGFYRTLAGQGGDLPWDKTHLFLVDERFVPPDDADSNYRLLTESLLSSVPIPLGNIHPVPVAPDPETAARVYEQSLAEFFRLRQGDMPRFDLIMLGVGEDGHTASLFPGSPAVCEKERLVRAVEMAGVRRQRMTLTLPVLNNAGKIVFLVSGASKADVLRDIVRKAPESLPAARVKPVDGELVFMADPGAGSLLAAA